MLIFLTLCAFLLRISSNLKSVIFLLCCLEAISSNFIPVKFSGHTLTEFPYLLPANYHFTMLMVHAIHERLCHAGVNSTGTTLHQSYWIPAIRQYVKKILRKRVICTKFIGKRYKIPDSPPLPKL